MAVAESLPVTASTGGHEPTVIVDHVHIVYRVHGGSSHDADGADVRGSGWGRFKRRPQPAPMREVHAVRGVTFVAHRGEAIGLIGSNGSGKSTLMRAIAGLIPAERGRVYTAGRPSLLGVNAALMTDLTGDKNVRLGGLAMGMSPDEIRANYRHIVEFSGINEKGNFISLPMRTYSSGMSARLRFSIAAARRRDVLLVDEALTTGDRAFKKRSSERIQELKEQAGTVLLVSHSASSIRENCERVLWLEKGELLMDGPADEVLAAYEART